MNVPNQIIVSVFCAFSIFICGIFITSMILGVYVFYVSDLGGSINYEYPINSVMSLYGGSAIQALNGLTIGHVFAAVWAAIVGLFVIAIKGSKFGYFHALEKMRTGTKSDTISNYMLQATKWFSIIVILSITVIAIQSIFGINADPPEYKNDLTVFYEISKAPFVEEAVFRILLIGVPLYMIYSHKISGRHFLRSLYHPNKHLHIEKKLFTIILICIIGSLFGLAHILSDQAWGDGKAIQASIGGIIIGWVYFRYGLVPALLIHIMTNYMLIAAISTVAIVLGIPIIEAESSQFIQTVQILLLMAGISALLVVIYEIKQKKSTNHYNL